MTKYLPVAVTAFLAILAFILHDDFVAAMAAGSACANAGILAMVRR